jgi:hypothetical protein
MSFVESVAMEKMTREGKSRWGTKSTSSYEDLHELYPDACFLFMKRDGRDIAASRKHVGDFHQSIDRIAQGWQKQLLKFRKFCARPGVRGRMVDYERLTSHPADELREIIEFLQLPWSDGMLQFHDQDLSIYRQPMGHLSANQVNKPINSSSVGRWKHQLTSEEVRVFESVAGDTLMAMGYPLSSNDRAAAHT